MNRRIGKGPIGMERNVKSMAWAVAALCLTGTDLAAGLELGHPFADNMVLQRGMPVRVWGWADAGAKVTVSFAGQTVSGRAGADGEWRVELAPMAASAEGRTLKATAAGVSNCAQPSLNGTQTTMEGWFFS